MNVRRRSLLAAVVALAVVTLPGAVTPLVASAASGPIRILTLGDSITAHCGDVPPAGYCGPLGTMLTQAGVPHTFINEAVAGTDCGYTATNIHTFLTRDLPNPQPTDLVLLDCGTNNVPVTATAQDTMGTQWRTIVEAVKAYGVQLGISFIGYSNPTNASTAGSGLPQAEADANDVIYRNMQLYPSSYWTGLADFQQLPGNLTYLDSGGIHPIPLGYQEMAAIWYRALQAAAGWPGIVTQPCGMWGYRPGGSPPPFILCTGTTP